MAEWSQTKRGQPLFVYEGYAYVRGKRLSEDGVERWSMREGFNEAMFGDQLEEFIEGEIRDLCNNLDGGVRQSGKPKMDLETRQCCAFLRRTFEEADQDNTGTLDIEEFNRGFAGEDAKQEMERFGIKYEDIRLLFREMDSRKSGGITSDEMINVFIDMKRKCAGQDRVMALLEECFREADENQRGSVPREVFDSFFHKRRIVAKLGAVGVDADDMTELLLKLDADGSSTVTVDEVVSAFLTIRDPSHTTQSALAFLKQTAHEMAIDGKKKLSLLELRRILSNPNVVKRMKRLKVSLPSALECFAVFDSDQGGELSWQEIYDYMESKMIPKRMEPPRRFSAWGNATKSF
eukprot:GEMP01037483.1.p1 GENE.GEMP01037483.1~~GEMP01037483.1.p1  ORF type:complete len:356 (+),score=60.21 GEMP01037483.1:24-1070(+)